MTGEYFEANRRGWDELVPVHVRSDFYDVEGFKAGKLTANQLEREDLGDVSGKTLLHLQCHFGQDTLSWARLGAQVTGLDFSEPAIAAARQLAEEISVEARFVCANVYEAAEALRGEQFDIVLTGGGALVWLPDMTRWAEVAASCVRPGGVLYVREFHPFSHVFDDERDDDELRVRYPYFSSGEPTKFEGPLQTYADSYVGEPSTSYEWPHPLGEVVTAIAGAGLRIEFLHEVDYTEFQAMTAMVRDGEERRWRLPEHAESIPLQYSVLARKPA